MVSFELVAQTWRAGERRAAGLSPDQTTAVDRVVDGLVAELRRRLGSTFTVDELVALYDADISWCLDLAYAIAPGAPWAWDPRVTTDAAFARYVREAQDFAGGRRLDPDG
ncbi:MAG: hypothetical protein H0V81_13280 [Solirubrobacterales bacterium]|nr:hypothetical protein [Solirubrobacterales bacterium]